MVSGTTVREACAYVSAISAPPRCAVSKYWEPERVPCHTSVHKTCKSSSPSLSSQKLEKYQTAELQSSLILTLSAKVPDSFTFRFVHRSLNAWTAGLSQRPVLCSSRNCHTLSIARVLTESLPHIHCCCSLSSQQGNRASHAAYRARLDEDTFCDH